LREEGSADRYVTDAFTDRLTDSLAHFSDIKVLSRQTAHLFLTKSGDVTRLGSELGVRYVLEASLQPRASSTVINVELIDAAKGVAIWSERAATASATLERDGTDISEALARNIDTTLKEFSRGTPVPDSRDIDAAALAPR
jgi:TolB-like protein